MNRFDYSLDIDDPAMPPMGLIVLAADETLEIDMARALPNGAGAMFVSRIPSAPEITPDTLNAMADHITTAAGLLPRARPFGVVGYGCTSAAAVLGSDAVARMVQAGCDTAHVTDPLAATIACARHHGISRLALLSPYIETVNEPLRASFARAGLSTDHFGTFAEAEEARVVRISIASIVDAATRLGRDEKVDGVFLSCTNLRTFKAIPQIEAEIGKPVFSSNQALAWHMRELQKG
ncbi:MAG: Asp/Glu racemase [Sulfitobacter sp.]|nr:Asp/Glu racemase [Sulfitobacter sp.]